MFGKRKQNIHFSAVFGRRSTAILKGIGKGKHVESVSGELVSDLTLEKITCTVKRTERNLCDITFKPTTLGRHKLHIKVDGKPVAGSPFPVSVSSPTVHTFSTPMKSITNVRGPWGVATNKRGDIIVVESKECRVTTFSPGGDRQQSFQRELSVHHHEHHRHTVKSPRGVAVDSHDNILITDWDRHCIHKFTSEGVHVVTVGKEGSNPLEFRNPCGISIHPQSQKIYVAEYGNHCIQILNSDLTFSNSFGCHGNSNGQFNHPHDVAFDSVGYVYVTDHDNHRIQVFTAEGQFLNQIGQWGTGDGDLQNPYSIIIDRDNMIYVTEGGNYRVSKFKTDGEFQGLFGVEKKRLYMNALCGIAVTTGSNNTGVLCVGDYVNNCLLFFNTDLNSHELNES